MNISTEWVYTDEDGLNPLGVPADIIFWVYADFQPAEPMVMYYKDGSGYPGCDAQTDITKVVATEIVVFPDTKRTKLSEEQSKLISDWMFGRVGEDSIYNSILDKFEEDSCD